MEPSASRESFAGVEVGHEQIADLIDEALREVLQVGLLSRSKAVGDVKLPSRRSTAERLSSSGAFYSRLRRRSR